MDEQQIEAHVNDDLDVTGTVKTPGSISADTYEFTVVNDTGGLVVRILNADIEKINNGSSVTKGVVTVHMTNKLDIAPGYYTWRWRRTNAGREKVLGRGPFRLLPSYRDAT